jgi:hypothetical protein
MGWVSLANRTPDSFSSAPLRIGGIYSSWSVTLHVDPAAIFIAQISLYALFKPKVLAYISGITFQNGSFLDLSHSAPPAVEWAWAQSVTFVLRRSDVLSYEGQAMALATVTTYRG